MTHCFLNALQFFILVICVAPIVHSYSLDIIFQSPLLNSPHSLRPNRNKLYIEPAFGFVSRVKKENAAIIWVKQINLILSVSVE